jgi:hypothetical protein
MSGNPNTSLLADNGALLAVSPNVALVASANTSASGSFLYPTVLPLMGQELMRVLQQLVAGVSGIPGNLVRPSWQSEPANVPDFSTCWCAIRIRRRETQGFSWQEMSSDALGYTLSRQEEMELLCSFYDNGVDQVADQYAMMLRDGLQLGQNRETLVGTGIEFVSAGSAVPLPSLLKQRWLYRVDLPLRFRRDMVWTYPVLSVVSATAVIQTETVGGQLITQTITLP